MLLMVLLSFSFFLYFLFPIIVVLFIWIGQTILDKKVAKVMQTKSEFQIKPIAETHLPNKQESGQQIIFDEKSIFLGNIEDTWKRRIMINRSKARLKKSLYFNITAGIGYIVFPAAFLLLMPENNEWAEHFYSLGMIFILYHFFRYQVFMNEITLEEKKGRDFFGYVLGRLYGIIGYVANLLVKSLPKSNDIYPLIFFILFMNVAVASMYNSLPISIGLIIAFILHIFLQVRLYKWVKRFRNFKLLILRVFNFESSTKFTFNEIWKYWRYIGSFLTVTDESLLTLQKRKIWRNLFSILIFAYLIQSFVVFLLIKFMVFIGIKVEGHGYLISIPFIIIIAGVSVYYIYSYIKIKQNFIGNLDDLNHQLDQIKKRPFSILSTFRGISVRCYDNTWSFVVSEFVQFSDVILMDLRGYSESRKGCQQEVNQLLNLVTVSKITFLVGKADLSKVKALLEESCQDIICTSPNFNAESIQIKIHVNLGAKKAQIFNVQGIIATLIDSIPITKKPKKT